MWNSEDTNSFDGTAIKMEANDGLGSDSNYMEGGSSMYFNWCSSFKHIDIKFTNKAMGEKEYKHVVPLKNLKFIKLGTLKS